MRYLDSEINRLIAQTKSPVFHNVLMDLRDLRKLARDFFKKEDAYKVSDWSGDQNERIAYEKAHDALKAHLEAKP